MNLPTEINHFSGPWSFLSNFYPCQVRLDGEIYASVEHAYQAAKTLRLEDREKFRYDGVTAGKAKRMGAHLKLRTDWADVKLNIMQELLEQKFYPTILRRKLLATFNAELVEGNNWHDLFFGVCEGACRQGPHEPEGLNHLGRLLMEVRKYYSTYINTDIEAAMQTKSP